MHVTSPQRFRRRQTRLLSRGPHILTVGLLGDRLGFTIDSELLVVLVLVILVAALVLLPAVWSKKEERRRAALDALDRIFRWRP